MKLRMCVLNLILFFFSISLIVIANQKAFAFHVIIDPGHGGQDSGASSLIGNGKSQKKVKEAQIVYEVSEKLKKQIEKTPGWSASLSRDGKNYVPLKQRIVKAHEENGDLLVSIHANSSFDTKARGPEFYFQDPHMAEYEGEFYNRIPTLESGSFALIEEGSKKEEVRGILSSLKRQNKIHKSKDLALVISDHFKNAETTRANIIQQAPFYVVTKTEMPSILIELGFVSNAIEVSQLQSSEYQENLAQQIFQGLSQFKEIIEKEKLTK